ncbi:Required for respiratory growth protein 9 mitochondrial [Elasticomyces elasticus]|nr:hypothetical protein LTR28_000129 [Elasticomyces elasticus]KAK4985854.1 Required for respiratory growth protein 9 mitochondrial [Elasticomyces elasticus]KAK4988678.1 Required for respiratory growth protein 9 mitochondrial [Elasticomyces elasticus]
MSPCLCPVRALDVFVRNIAGLDLSIHSRAKLSQPLHPAYKLRLPRSRGLHQSVRSLNPALPSPPLAAGDAFASFDPIALNDVPELQADTHPRATRAYTAPNSVHVRSTDTSRPEIETRADAGSLGRVQEKSDLAVSTTHAVASNSSSFADLPSLIVPLGQTTLVLRDGVDKKARWREDRKALRQALAKEKELHKAAQKARMSVDPTSMVSKPSGILAEIEEEAAKARARVQNAAQRRKLVRRVDNSTETAAAPSLPAKKFKREPWQTQKAALASKFGETGYAPRKLLSPDTRDGIRVLHASDPAKFTTPILSEHFKVSPEAIRRILKSKWQPSEEEAEDRRLRWERRGERKWTEMVELGMRPPKKWREMGVGKAEKGEKPRWKKIGKVSEGQRQGVDSAYGTGGDEWWSQTLEDRTVPFERPELANRFA